MTVNANRELLALRTHLAARLQPADAAALAWPTVASVAGPGIGRGWRGEELACAAMLGAYSDGVVSVPAYVVSALRDLAAQDPPRESTPQPLPVQQVLASIHRANEPSRQAADWVAKLRTGANR